MAYDLGTARGKIELEYEGRDAVDKTERDMDRVDKKSKETDKSLKRLGATLKGLFTGLKFASLAVAFTNAAIAAANVVIQIAGMVTQLASLLSLTAAIPSAFIGIAAAIGVVKAITAGLGDTLKAAFDPKGQKKFAEGLKELSPSAQAFAKAVQSNVKSLKDYQKSLQETFFSQAGLTQAVPKVIGALKTITPVLQGLASDFAKLTRRAVTFATSAKSVDFVRNSIAGFRAALSEASSSMEPLLTGLRDVGGVGIPLLAKLGKLVGDLGTKFGQWLSNIANSGQLQTWINTAIQTLGTLGDILKNVGSILGSVFSAAGETSGGLLDTIAKVTGAFSDFLNTAEGSAAIRSLFAGIGAAASKLAPVITTLVGALAGALGPALLRLSNVLGPALLSVVEALAPALGPVANAIVDVVQAVAPLLPPLAQLVAVLAKMAGGILSTVAAEFGPLIGLLGQALTNALTTLAPVFEQLFVQTLPVAAQAGQALFEAFKPLLPVFAQFATVLAGALAENMPRLVDAITQLVPVMAQFAAVIAQNLVTALNIIIPMLPTIISLFTTIAVVATKVQAAFLTVYTAAASFAGALVRFFTTLPGKVGSAISSLPSTIGNVIKTAAQRAAFLVGAMIGTLITIAVQLPKKIASAISNLPNTISSVIRSAWSAAKSAFSTGVSNVVSLAHTLPGKIKSAIGNVGSLLRSAGLDIVNGLISGIKAGVGAAVAAARSLGSSVLSGIKSTLKISSPSKEMIKIGQFVTQGLTKGMLGTASQVQSASNKLANMVLQAFSDKLITKKTKNTVLSYLNGATKQMLALIKQSDTVAAKLKSAQEKLADVQKSYNDTFNSAVEKTKASFSLVTAGQQFVNLDATKERFQDAVDQAKKFAANIQSLVKRGLNKDLLQQLVDAGAADGGAMAAALASADDATLKQFNNLQTQLNAAATKVGKTTADAMYGAGLQAAKGLVAGLTKQQKQIDAAMERIADALVARIKKALKIKSPSRVMFALGKFTTEGLLNGLKSLKRQVAIAAEQLATTSIIPTVQLATSTASANAQQSASAASIGGSSYSVTQNVYALPGMSASAVAAYSLTKLRYGLMSGVAAAALPAPSTAGA